ncbi:MAG: Gx transporter family protein [Eubacteriales bacterium]|nr:Gx transporter family protein [Eubacteriales bacterium]MDY3332540.1 Gx transporter family protein [Gallibacter sp.]
MQSRINNGSKANYVAITAVMVALAMMFSYVEAMFPIAIAIPGIKLGIANIVVLIALYLLNAKYALLINVIRIFLVGFLFTGTFGIIYSLAGGLLSYAVMVLLKKTNWFSIIGISMAGGVFHNLGQLITAGLIVENMNIFLYFPILLFSGMITGVLMGIVASIVMGRLKIQI